ncbi:MAG: hypothetical protein C5B58_01090 [Acidobacteria bacterium]|nr:MAG: hypothetical protein C5B58_01090 [Acidobacteriota bacterium]
MMIPSFGWQEMVSGGEVDLVGGSGITCPTLLKSRLGRGEHKVGSVSIRYELRKAIGQESSGRWHHRA